MSVFRDALRDYLATRRALGAKLRYPESALRHFIDFLESIDAEYITVDAALRWAITPAGVKQATWARRLGMARGFAVWLQATDPRTEVPPMGVLPTGQKRPLPYIYKDKEIAALMQAAHHLRSGSGLRRWTYATLVGLLTSTGLRPGEALALDLPDVNLSTGVLAIRESKFGKSRFVPVEASTRMALVTYAQRRDDILPHRETAAFLVCGRGRRLTASAVQRTFAKLCKATGLRPQTDSHRSGRGPRLQDMRHTFATRRLATWYEEGYDVERLMPALSTYLGHVRVEDTYWYIQAVPELLKLATDRVEARARGGGR